MGLSFGGSVMRQIKSLAWLTSIFVFFSPALAVDVEIPEGLRLIQTSETQIQWMDQDQIFELSRSRHQQGFCGGFMDVTDEDQRSSSRVTPVQFEKGRIPKQQKKVTKLIPGLSLASLTDTVTHLSTQYLTRRYNTDGGRESAEWIKDQFDAHSLGRSDVKVNFFEHNFEQFSVIAEIEGEGALKDEIVVIGAHEDSISWSYGEGGAPGADDDASGTATVIEIFRTLVSQDYKPKRTLQFMTYAAEEVGLIGSQKIAKAYKDAGKQVIAVLQFDMTMYPGSGQVITLVNDYVNTELTTFLATLIDEYIKIPWQEDSCGYGCSDHASWNRYGFPAVFPFESALEDYNPAIHTPRDTIDNLDFDFGLHFAKLGLAFAVELASGD